MDFYVGFATVRTITREKSMLTPLESTLLVPLDFENHDDESNYQLYVYLQSTKTAAKKSQHANNIIHRPRSKITIAHPA
jgi:hypothetical protein